MRSHVVILGWLHIAWNILYVIAGAFLLLGSSVLAAAAAAGGTRGAVQAGIAFGGLGLFFGGLLLVIGLPGVIVGIGLLKGAPWARIAGIVFSILDLPVFPLGTALGAYGLWTLLNQETVLIFERGTLA
jgi:hypothetical protein